MTGTRSGTHALFSLEHSRAAYWADFGCYGLASATMGLALLLASPTGHGLALAGWAAAGMATWTLAEYLLHRFVLHGLPPFNRWHAEHHRRPAALIGSPTLLSASLFAVLAAAPAAWLLGAWPGCALLFGLVTGYLLYGLSHHAMHHAMSPALQRWPWLARRRRWHARHHRAGSSPGGHFGVTSGLWDRVFDRLGRSAQRP